MTPFHIQRCIKWIVYYNYTAVLVMGHSVFIRTTIPLPPTVGGQPLAQGLLKKYFQRSR